MGEEKSISEGIKPELRALLVNMTFIGNCPENRKIYVSGRDYIPKNGWSYVNLKRNLWETGDTLIHFINEIINQLKQIMKEEKDSRVKTLLVGKIEGMVQGMKHLRDTYAENPGVSSAISVAIDEVELLK